MIKSFMFNCHKCGREEKITAKKFMGYAKENFQCSCRMGYPAQKLFWVSDMLVRAWKEAKEYNLILTECPVISIDTRQYNYSFLSRLVFNKTAFIFNPLSEPQECGHGEIFIPSGFIPHLFQPPKGLAQFQPELGNLLYLAARWNLEMYDFAHDGRIGRKEFRYTIHEVETYTTLKS